MKKIGIITIHKAYNFGAVLQATALLEVVKQYKENCDCELIDYDSQQLKKDRQIFVKSLKIADICRNFRNLLSYRTYKKRAKAFEDFMKEYYRLSPCTYHTRKDFISQWNSSNYTCVITGSDQTFCLHLRDNIEAMRPYFLEFVQGKKISYAASFGEKIDLNTIQEEQWMKGRLQEYNVLAVRETASAEYVEKLLGERPQVVVDPTLLLNCTQWDKFAKQTKYADGRYILFYSVLSADWVVDEVKKLAKLTGLKVIVPHLKNRYELKGEFIRAIDVGPAEFLSLIKNAEYVVTTSFHATVFSITYKKNFTSLLLGKGNRISSLLKLCGLEHRSTACQGELLLQYQQPIEYKETDRLLEKEREKSLAFLKNALDL